MQREHGEHEWDEQTNMAYGTHLFNILKPFSTLIDSIPQSCMKIGKYK
jgi:hypothetical protein